jgi:hypothetical protein
MSRHSVKTCEVCNAPGADRLCWCGTNGHTGCLDAPDHQQTHGTSDDSDSDSWIEEKEKTCEALQARIRSLEEELRRITPHDIDDIHIEPSSTPHCRATFVWMTVTCVVAALLVKALL